MQATSSDLLERCAELDARRIALADRLSQAARLLEEGLSLPAESLVADLAAYRNDYERVAAAAGVAATASLTEIRQQLDALHRRRQAISRLECCFAVSSPQDPDLAPMYHERVRDVQTQLDSRSQRADELIAAIEQGVHPALCLWKLASRPGSLGDDEWQSAIESVKKTFGASLAVAAARGRLSVRPTAPSPVSIHEAN